MTTTPSVGRIVHYVSHGTPFNADGSQRYPSTCRAAVVTEVVPDEKDVFVHLAVLNPTGMFFNGPCIQDEDNHHGGSWHWPEKVE